MANLIETRQTDSDLASRVAELRRANGWSVGELARAMGEYPHAIRAVESGERLYLSPTRMAKLARALSVPEEDLLTLLPGGASRPRTPKARLVSELGMVLRTLRITHGLTQNQLAEGSGFDTSLVNRLETGKARVISAGQVRALAERLQVDEDVLWATVPGGRQEGRYISLLEETQLPSN